jgi:large subunit ribosomal protein L6
MTASAKLEVQVAIPAGVEIKIEDSLISVSGPKGTLKRELAYPGVKIHLKEEMLNVSAKTQRKVIKAMSGTIAAHIRNMIKGVSKGFEYRLKVVSSHFPITVKHEGNTVYIDNFLGEKTPRKSRVLGDCTINIKGDMVTVSGSNIEDVAQTAANIELTSRVKGRDRRVFQDGVYIVSKGVLG